MRRATPTARHGMVTTGLGVELGYVPRVNAVSTDLGLRPGDSGSSHFVLYPM